MRKLFYRVFFPNEKSSDGEDQQNNQTKDEKNNKDRFFIYNYRTYYFSSRQNQLLSPQLPQKCPQKPSANLLDTLNLFHFARLPTSMNELQWR